MSKSLETFGKYILLEKLASGGMAEVYLAKSTGAGGINKFVAIKRILPQYSDNIEFIDMFKEEASIAVNLNHGNVVSIFDFGVEKKQFFLVMEYVEGQNLRQILNHLKKENKYFSIDQIVYMCKEVAAGLDHAHRCLDGTTGKPLNITHRDMSPQNIMVSFEGEVKVVDFGIAKKAESEVEATRAGTIKGKFGYMSPEQADGQVVDLRTDIFSLGTVLWELLANDRLFASNSEAATLKKIRECQIPSLRKLNPSIPPELERIVNKALAKDKTLRYQTAASFHRDLNRFLNTQYPEFSPHDFSVFMKTAFSSMFMENRKKLIEFAKVRSDDILEASFTSTSTETESSENGDQFTGASLKLDLGGEDGAPPAPPPDLSNLGKRAATKQPAFIGAHTTGFEKVNRTTTNGPRTISQSISRRNVKEDSSWPTVFGALILVGGILAGGWLYLNKEGHTNLSSTEIPIDKVDVIKDPPPAQTPKLETQQVPSATAQTHQNPSPAPTTLQIDTQAAASMKEAYTIIIQSFPSGARIYIDGQDSGMITPAQRSIEAGREFTVGLKREGYQYYERKEVASNQGQVIKGSLQPNPKMGYINLDVVNGGLNPVVIINGIRIEEKLPLKNYAVIAGTPITIQAHNPFTGLWGEQTVQVGINQRVQVNLLLTQKKAAENTK